MEGDRDDEGFTVVFESLGSTPGLDVIDPIERRRRSFHTPDPVAPEPADSSQFPFPVETAVAVTTASLSMPTAEQVIVRDADGQMIEEVEHGESRSFPADAYVLEPTGIVRSYVRVDGALSVEPDGHATRIAFEAPTSIAVGARSAHERPAATVTTTADPADVLAAISTFGSALKTTSPERAFGSFRGHPPAIEIGPELSIPDGLEPPADGLHIEVPAAYRYALPVAPLAFYLGCPVRPGPEPRLVGDGIDHDLERTGSFEAGVRRTLERIFLLECVTRTDGLYRIDLHERERLAERVDLPFADLYESPQTERIRSFLEVPHELVEDLIPEWRSAAQVEASVDSLEALPYLVDDLALIEIADPEQVSSAVIESGGAQGLIRGGHPAQGSQDETAQARPRDGDGPALPRGEAVAELAQDSTATRPAQDSTAAESAHESTQGMLRGGAAADTTFVKPRSSLEAREETWVGEGTPIGATKAVTAAYRNRIGRTPTTGDIDISVVCNADAMAAEGDLVDEVYGSRANLPFDVSVHRDVTTDELAALLAEEREFFHYIGHIRDAGFECRDGHLDVATLESVGMDAFFLNACQSYEQGMALIEKGAIGGIVTIRDVVNHGAVRIGRAVARLLNYGFPLRPALEIAREESIVGALYIVVGDGGLSIAQTAGGTPMLIEIEGSGPTYSIRIHLYGAETGLGGVCVPHLDGSDQYYLASSTTEPIEVEAADLATFLGLDDGPLLVDDQLCWIDDVDLTSF